LREEASQNEARSETLGSAVRGHSSFIVCDATTGKPGEYAKADITSLLGEHMIVRDIKEMQPSSVWIG
jgi:hypothetical protein